MKVLLPFLLIFLLDWNSSPTEKKPNILFIAVDDLRPELGCYGNAVIQTPNIDLLAKDAHLFQNHFVSVPTCGASRYALLTGLYPRTKKHLSNSAAEFFLANQPESSTPETFVHHLRRNGYYTLGIGKISHYPEGKVYPYDGSPEGAPWELPHSWNEFLFNPGKWGNGHNAFFGYADGSNRTTLNKQVKPYEMADVPDEGYVDGLTANLAVKQLKRLGKSGNPFFMAVGFFKPHLPFTAPKKYWDLYDQKAMDTAPFQGIPLDAWKGGLHPSSEFNQYALGEEKASVDVPVSKEYAQLLRHAYYACISYTDAQVGKLLQTLKKEGLYENTVIVLWGDHGWHLGDHTIWGKHTVYDRALHSPLIIKTTKQESSKIAEVVSSVDLYPTLVQLARLKMPHSTDGESLTNLMQGEIKNWRNHAFSYFNDRVSVRTPQYRISQYSQPETMELYDLKNDPNETRNIAKNNSNVLQELSPLLDHAKSFMKE